MRNPYLGTRSKRSGGLRKTVVQPETLYKRSHLLLDPGTDEILLQALAHYVTLGPNADAECADVAPCSTAPRRFCSCGFYAYKEYADAFNHDQGGDCILQVVASGKMYEYDKGYRYGHQRVEQVTAPVCTGIDCSSAPDRLVVINMTGMILPVCLHHSWEGNCYTAMSFAEFEEKISASLPAGAPPITISNGDPATVPWVRGEKPPRGQRVQSIASRRKEPKAYKTALAAGVFLLGALTKK